MVKHYTIMKLKTLIILLFLTPAVWGQDTLSLQECRRLALQNNLKVKIARENVAKATSLKKFAKTYFFPSFSATGSYRRVGSNFSLLNESMFLPVVPNEARNNHGGLDQEALDNNPQLAQATFAEIVPYTDDAGNILLDESGEPIMGPKLDENGDPVFKQYTYLPQDEVTIGSKNLFMVGANMNQTVYAGGKVRKTHEAAQINEKIARNKQEMKTADILLETEESYWRVISVKEKVKMAREYKSMLQKLLNDLKNYKEEGIITNNELLKAKVKLNNVELQLMQAKNGLHLSRMALNQLIGLPMDSTVQLKGRLDTSQVKLMKEETLLDMAMNQRPEIKALENGIKLSGKGVELMQSRFMPNIGLQAGYMFMNPNPYNGFANEFGGDWSVGLTLQMPLFQWGNRLHTLEAAKSEKRRAQYELQDAREKIRMEVKKKRYEYNEKVKKVRMTRLSMEQAKENLELTRNNFEEGMLKTSDLLEAQAMYQDARSKHIDAMTELRLKQTALQKAAGKLLQQYRQQQEPQSRKTGN